MSGISRVYFKPLKSGADAAEVGKSTRELIAKLVEKEKIKLEKEIPLKVHFGEKGNTTYLKPECYDGIIDFLQEKEIATSFIETTVMYGGQRHSKKLHIALAKDHGFSRIPIVIADGDNGESYYEIEIDKKHFKKVKLGAAFEKYSQFIVLVHFKGHGLAGFGGAIKQLGMGFGSKGGKLAMHMGIKPRIKNGKCKRCHDCEKRCAEGAITIPEKSSKEKSRIDNEKCVGCGACVSICPYQAVTIFSLKGIFHAIRFGSFRERIVEHAYAAQTGKRNIYLNFIMNVTGGCDCEPKKMKPLIDDVGIMISSDPVAIDMACWDMVKQKGKKFSGKAQLEYAEKIGIGSTRYELITLGDKDGDKGKAAKNNRANSFSR